MKRNLPTSAALAGSLIRRVASAASPRIAAGGVGRGGRVGGVFISTSSSCRFQSTTGNSSRGSAADSSINSDTPTDRGGAFVDPPAPAMPPGYVPVSERAASDESLRFASSGVVGSNPSAGPISANSTKSSAEQLIRPPSDNANNNNTVATTAGSGASPLSTTPKNPSHLVEGYVREDGKILRRRGDGEGAILEFVDPLPPTKLGQLKHDVVNRDIPDTPKAIREAAVKSFIAKDDITRGFGSQSREDFVARVDEAQRRKDGGVPDEQLPIFDETGRKTLRRETGRGYRSVDGGKILIPKENAPALEEGAAVVGRRSAAGMNDGEEGHHHQGSNTATSSSSSSAACDMTDDAEQQAALEALRRRRRSRSSKLFNNINTIDEDESTKVAQPFTMATKTGPQSFTRHEGGDETLTEAEQIRRFDPLRQMLHEEEKSAQARKAAARQRSVWADEILNDDHSQNEKEKHFRGDPLSEKLKEYSSPLGSASSKKSFFEKMDHRSAAANEREEDVNEAGDEKITAASASADAKMKLDVAQYRKDLEELDYYVGSNSYEERKKAFDAKYNVDEWTDEQKKQFRSRYTKEQIEQGLEGEPISLSHSSIKLQQAAASNPMLKFHPGIVSSQMGLANNAFKGYAFSPSLELGKLQKDVAIEAARQQSVEQKVKAKDIAERITGFDPVQRKQVRLVLADFDHKDPHTAVHVLHSYPYSDNISVMLVGALFLFLYKTQDALDADEFYQEYLGIDIRTLPTLRKPMYMVIAFIICSCMLHPCNLAAIAITRSYRIFMRRPIGPP